MRTIFAALAFALHFIALSVAHASEVPKFDQPSEWVEIADLEQILEEAAESEALLVILDQQSQLVPGTVSSYRDVAIRIDSAKTMSNMISLFSPVWHPDQGDLIVHRYEIIRGSDIIDLTTGDDIFQVIRREQNLERQMIDGRLTAISQIEDLQLHDIVRMSFTVTHANEALADRVQSAGGFVTEDLNVDFIRQTVRWPDEMSVNWRVSKDEIVPQKTADGGWTTLHFNHRAKEPDVEIPKNAPLRFQEGDYYEIASFKSWRDVSQVSADLYPDEDGVVSGGALDLEIKAIANRTSDKEERMALALRLVQDRTRYLYNGLGFGNYTPQTPEETWRLRYGDCKAKTYLLLAAFRRLGIKSVPMLVHTSQRDAIGSRLPSFQAFNHIIVKAELNGKVYWLDGTGNGTRQADMGDSPTHRYGLPSSKDGAELEEIAIRRPGRPFQMVDVIYDLTAGTDLPAPFELTAVLRDGDVEKLKDAAAQLSADKAKDLREEVALDYVLDGLVTEAQFTYDEELETGYLSAKGLSYLDWDTKAGRRKHKLWSPAGGFEVQKSRDEEELRDLPVRLSYPSYFKYNVTYKLPERYSAAELRGWQDVEDEVAGFQFVRSVRKDGNRVISEEEYHTNRWELPASAFEPERQKLTLLERHRVEIFLPDDVPAPSQEMETLKSSASLILHRAAFDTNVENADADDESALTSRAYFFQTTGDYERAIADLQAALRIETNPGNFTWLGDLQLGTDPAAAKESFRSAIEISPTYFDALLNLIRLHIVAGEYDEANLVLDTARQNGLRDASADSLQIEIQQSEGDFDEALAIMDALVEEKPDSASYLSDRCLLRAMENRDLDLALEDCTNMIELAERRAYYHYIRALVYYRQGQYQSALADLDKAIGVNDNYAYLYNLRAATHSKMGNAELAERDRNTAVYHFKYAGWYWNRFVN